MGGDGNCGLHAVFGIQTLDEGFRTLQPAGSLRQSLRWELDVLFAGTRNEGINLVNRILLDSDYQLQLQNANGVQADVQLVQQRQRVEIEQQVLAAYGILGSNEWLNEECMRLIAHLRNLNIRVFNYATGWAANYNNTPNARTIIVGTDGYNHWSRLAQRDNTAADNSMKDILNPNGGQDPYDPEDPTREDPNSMTLG